MSKSLKRQEKTPEERLFIARVHSAFLQHLGNLSEPDRFRAVMDKFQDDYVKRAENQKKSVRRYKRNP